MMVRVLLSGGTGSGAFRCMVASLLAFLARDVAWVSSPPCSRIGSRAALSGGTNDEPFDARAGRMIS